MHLLVMAKAPVAGNVKTRLVPPCTHEEAAILAEAALCDTLDAAVRTRRFTTKLLALDGRAGPWLEGRSDMNVFAQQGAGFAARLQNAWDAAGGPGVQIGMDTPQVTPELLDGCAERLIAGDDVDAAIGMARDGGWWALALRRPVAGLFDGISMSTPDTGLLQYRRLVDLGMTVTFLPELRDIDTAADAVAVAGELPGSRFAHAVAAIPSLTFEGAR